MQLDHNEQMLADEIARISRAFTDENNPRVSLTRERVGVRAAVPAQPYAPTIVAYGPDINLALHALRAHIGSLARAAWIFRDAGKLQRVSIDDDAPTQRI